MNRELVVTSESAGTDAIRDLVVAMGITAVPVLDVDRRPVGVLSLRDMLEGGPVSAHASRPAITVPASATLDEAGLILARTGLHQVVVVDGAGRAVGMLSALDVLRELLGLPAHHPAGFPHMDAELEVSWTDDRLLSPEALGGAPEGPGVVVLVRGGRGVPDAPVWVEACERVYARLDELLSIPQSDSPALAALLAHGGLRYRAAAVPDPAKRARIAGTLGERIAHQVLPASAEEVQGDRAASPSR